MFPDRFLSLCLSQVSSSGFAQTLQSDLSFEDRREMHLGRSAALICEFGNQAFDWRKLADCRRDQNAGQPDTFKVAMDRELLSSLEIADSVARDNGSSFRRLHSFQALEQSLLHEYKLLKRSTGASDADMCEGEIVDPESCTEVGVGSFGILPRKQAVK